MAAGIRELEPTGLFSIFDDLVAIPRGSKKEDAAREYCLDWARRNGFDIRQDAAGSVAITVPATPGFENSPGVVIQGHLDIVWEKTPDNPINFETDPIPAYVDGDHIRTKGTTLGADNGIGVAAGMWAALDGSCVHGPLELLLTVDEETGMGGAFGLEPDMLKGRMMLNLDSEEEGTMYVGCAGGGDAAITLPVTRTKPGSGWVACKLSVSGLKGGHSGLDIAAGRGNAIRILARMAAAYAPAGLPMICSIDGGTKRNAIPRDAEACVFVKEQHFAGFVAEIEKLAATIRAELGKADPGVTLKVTEVKCDCAAIVESDKVWNLLLALPTGPIGMSQAIVGLVETSTNLAIVKSTDTEVTVDCLSRSSVGSAMNAVRQTIVAAASLAGAACRLYGEYPGWRPDIDSRLLKTCIDLWKERTGVQPKVTAIHAGLECGVIGEKFPGMDMISFGPDIRGAHSPEENLSIPSTRRFYDFLKALLEKLAKG